MLDIHRLQLQTTNELRGAVIMPRSDPSTEKLCYSIVFERGDRQVCILESVRQIQEDMA